MTQERNLLDRVEALFREMSLDLQHRKPGNIVLTGFAVSNGQKAGITDFLNELAHTALARWSAK